MVLNAYLRLSVAVTYSLPPGTHFFCAPVRYRRVHLTTMSVEVSMTSEDEVEGQMNLPGNVPTGITRKGASLEFNTLDEPIKDTFMRDATAVAMKFKHVLFPTDNKSLLKDWDLWGPLILCTFLAVILQGEEAEVSGAKHDGGPEFAEVFVLVWVGAMVVTMNSKLLGGTLSFFQSVCVLGYCLLPPSVSLVFCRLVLLFEQNMLLFVFRFLFTMVGFAYAVYAALKFLGDSQPPNRKALAVYPIFLFYFIISWLIISHTQA